MLQIRFVTQGAIERKVSLEMTRIRPESSQWDARPSPQENVLCQAERWGTHGSYGFWPSIRWEDGKNNCWKGERGNSHMSSFRHTPHPPAAAVLRWKRTPDLWLSSTNQITNRKTSLLQTWWANWDWQFYWIYQLQACGGLKKKAINDILEELCLVSSVRFDT